MFKFKEDSIFTSEGRLNRKIKKYERKLAKYDEMSRLIDSISKKLNLDKILITEDLVKKYNVDKNELKKDFDLISFRCEKCAKELKNNNHYKYSNGDTIPLDKIKVIIVEERECENGDRKAINNPYGISAILLNDKTDNVIIDTENEEIENEKSPKKTTKSPKKESGNVNKSNDSKSEDVKEDENTTSKIPENVVQINKETSPLSEDTPKLIKDKIFLDTVNICSSAEFKNNTVENILKLFKNKGYSLTLNKQGYYEDKSKKIAIFTNDKNGKVVDGILVESNILTIPHKPINFYKNILKQINFRKKSEWVKTDGNINEYGCVCKVNNIYIPVQFSIENKKLKTYFILDTDDLLEEE